MSLATHQPPAASPVLTPATKDKWSASVYSTNASFVYSSAFTSAVLNLLAPQPGERILDLGAGSGEVTLEIAKAVQAEGKPGSVVGVDMSAALLRQAREGAQQAGVNSVEWIERDGHDLSGVEGGFDAAFSNAALHWMKTDPAKVGRSKACVGPETCQGLTACGWRLCHLVPRIAGRSERVRPPQAGRALRSRNGRAVRHTACPFLLPRQQG